MSRIVELDSSAGDERYFLPTHRAPLLAEGEASTLDIGLFLPWCGGDVYKRVLECFKKDGPRGVPYDAYEEAMGVVSKRTEKILRNQLVPNIINPYPELKDKLENGTAILDLGCGHGASTVTLGKAFPSSTVKGVDILERSIASAREANELKNVEFVVADAADLPEDWSGRYGFVFMNDTVHDMARPDKLLSEVYRVMAPGGICLICDIFSHSGAKANLEKSNLESMSMLYTMSTLHCMPVSLHFDGGMGLGTCWGRELSEKMIRAAGFEISKVIEDPERLAMVYYCRKQ